MTARRSRPRALFGLAVRKIAAPTTVPLAPGPAEPPVAEGTADSTLSSSGPWSVEPPVAGAPSRRAEASAPHASAAAGTRCPTVPRWHSRDHRLDPRSIRRGARHAARSGPAARRVEGKAPGAPRRSHGLRGEAPPGPARGPEAGRQSGERASQVPSSVDGRRRAGAENSATVAGAVALERRPARHMVSVGPTAAAADRLHRGAACLRGPLGRPSGPSSDHMPPRARTACSRPTVHAAGAAGTSHPPVPLGTRGSALDPMSEEASMSEEAMRALSAVSEAAFSVRDGYPPDACEAGGDHAVPPCTPAPGPSTGERGRVIGKPTAGCGDRLPSKVRPGGSLDPVDATARPLRGSIGTGADRRIEPFAPIGARCGSPGGRGRADRLWLGACRSLDATAFVADPSRPTALGSPLSPIRPAGALQARRGRYAAGPRTARARARSRSLPGGFPPVRVETTLTPVSRARNRASRPGSRAAAAAPIAAAAVLGSGSRGRP